MRTKTQPRRSRIACRRRSFSSSSAVCQRSPSHSIASFLFEPSTNSVVNIHALRVSPQFFPLRGDPRFEALLKDPKNNEPLF